MRRAAPLLCVFFLVAASGMRSLQVGYLSDDWVILEHISKVGNQAAWDGPWMGAHTMLFHRPLFTELYELEYRAFGAHPLPAHAIQLLWHLLAVGLVWWIVRLLGGSMVAALLATLLFGFHPQLTAATGWLAARCGTVAGTLTLLTVGAWLQGCRGRRWLWGSLALAAAGAAALTRESGYLALVAPFTIDFLLPAKRTSLKQLAGRHLPFMVLGLGLLVLRYRALGTLLGGYPGGSGLLRRGASWGGTFGEFGEALLTLFRALPADFIPDRMAQAAPAGLVQKVGAPLAWPTAVAAMSILMALCALGFRLWVHAGEKDTAPPRTLRTLLALFFTQGLLLLITGPLLAPSTGQRWYGATALFCILGALVLMPLLRRPFIYLPFLLVPAYGFGAFLVQDRLVEADRVVQRTLDQVHQELEALPPGIEALFVTHLPESEQGLPTFQWGISSALGPPFRKRVSKVPVYPVHQFMELGRHGFQAWPHHPPVEALLYAAQRPFMVLNFTNPPHPGGEYLTRVDWESFAPALGPPRGAKQRLSSYFKGPHLKVLAPGTGRQVRPGAIGSLPIVVRAEGLERVAFACFLPAADAWQERPVVGSMASIDLAPVLSDYIRFSRKPVRLYVLPLGLGHQGGKLRVSLGPLLSFDFLGQGR